MRNELTIEHLVEAYLDDMYATAIRLSGSHHVAEDLVQDLFVNLKIKRGNLNHVKNPRAWLASILYRKYVDWWRREKRSPIKLFDYNKSENNEINIENMPSGDPDPLQQLETASQSKKLLTALNCMSEEFRRMIILHDIEGYTLPEIQLVMDIPLGTLKSRLHRARSKLQKLLNSESPKPNIATYRQWGAKK